MRTYSPTQAALPLARATRRNVFASSSRAAVLLLPLLLQLFTPHSHSWAQRPKTSETAPSVMGRNAFLPRLLWQLRCRSLSHWQETQPGIAFGIASSCESRCLDHHRRRRSCLLFSPANSQLSSSDVVSAELERMAAASADG